MELEQFSIELKDIKSIIGPLKSFKAYLERSL